MVPKIIVLLFLILVHINFTRCAENLKIGPYVSYPVRSEYCKHRIVPQKNTLLTFGGVLYNSSSGITRLKGNVTFFRRVYDIRIKGRLYQHDNSTRPFISRIINSKGCQGMVLSSILRAFGKSFDTRKCAVQKGTFSMDIDPNMVEHMWAYTREYGRFLWVVEVLAGKNLVLCWEHEVLVKPLKPK